MEEKKRVSKAHMKATEKWEKNNYDRIMVRFPKGTKARINQTGCSVNGYIVQAVTKKLDEDGIKDEKTLDLEGQEELRSLGIIN